jgi:hypothetical protein
MDVNVDLESTSILALSFVHFDLKCLLSLYPASALPHQKFQNKQISK